MLAVSDAGPGLPASMRDRPFERFPHQPSAMHGGSGLGLSIVHALVDQQGGSVLADRSVRGGMRIQVCFPVMSRDAKASAGAGRRPSRDAPGRVHQFSINPAWPRNVAGHAGNVIQPTVTAAAVRYAIDTHASLS